jgi:quinol monooxygenase YgiN
MSQVIYIAKLTAKLGQRAALLAVVDDATKAAQDEPGTVAYVSHTIEDEPDSIYLYEVYASEEARAEHANGAGVAALRAALPAVLATPSAVSRVTIHGGFGVPG